jgi:hypothetical protein
LVGGKSPKWGSYHIAAKSAICAMKWAEISLPK